MKKDFSKSKFASRGTRRHGNMKWRVAVSFVVICLVAGGAGYYLSRQHPEWDGVRRLSSSLGQVEAWIVERKNRLGSGITKARQLAAVKQEDQPIHFEFYTELPSVKVPVPTEETRHLSEKYVSESAATTVSDRNNLNTTSTASVTRSKTSTSSEGTIDSQPVSQTAGKPLFDAEQLHRDLNEEFNQSQYIIQLGVFRSAASAERYRQSLTQTGLTASVVKAHLSERIIFRVQSGPFLTLSQAKQAQKQWQKKSIDGIVRKIDLSKGL